MLMLRTPPPNQNWQRIQRRKETTTREYIRFYDYDFARVILHTFLSWQKENLSWNRWMKSILCDASTSITYTRKSTRTIGTWIFVTCSVLVQYAKYSNPKRRKKNTNDHNQNDTSEPKKKIKQNTKAWNNHFEADTISKRKEKRKFHIAQTQTHTTHSVQLTRAAIPNVLRRVFSHIFILSLNR